jgi:hypothetical protein
MSTVEEIKNAIKMLSLEERAQIAAELRGWGDDDRDRPKPSDNLASQYLSSEQDSWESDLAAMATDPEMQRELNRNISEFNVTESDGLGKI